METQIKEEMKVQCYEALTLYFKWYNLKINYSKLKMHIVNPIATINKVNKKV